MLNSSNKELDDMLMPIFANKLDNHSGMHFCSCLSFLVMSKKEHSNFELNCVAKGWILHALDPLLDQKRIFRSLDWHG